LAREIFYFTLITYTVFFIEDHLQTKNMKLPVIISIIVVVLAIAIGIVIYLVSKSKTSASVVSETSSASTFNVGDRIAYTTKVKSAPSICAGSATSETTIIYQGTVTNIDGDNVYVQFDTITTPTVNPATSECQNGVSWTTIGKNMTADWIATFMGSPTTPPTYIKTITFPLKKSDSSLVKL
jgi:hypothetical protein